MGARVRIKNWQKFQHFKNRRPPWIKLYRDLLDDVEWHELDPLLAKSLTMLWLLASEGLGTLPPLKKISFRLRMTEKQIEDILSRLSHWLENDDITAISPRHQDDAPERETERETETETETENKHPCRASPDLVGEIFCFWQVERGHPQSKLDAKRRKAIKARLKEGYEIERIKAAIRGIANSPHHMGQNDRQMVYDDIELICRSGTNVDKFADMDGPRKIVRKIDMSRYETAVAGLDLKGGR